MLAVAALRLGYELNESRLVRGRHRRLLVVDEPAERRLPEPGLDRRGCRIRRPDVADDVLGDVVERSVLLHQRVVVEARVEEDRHEEVAVRRAELGHGRGLLDLEITLDGLGIVRSGSTELLRSRPRNVAPDRVRLVALQRPAEDDDIAALVLECGVGGRIPLHRLR